MDELYLAVMRRLANLDGISMIDEDHGQLETYEDGYPLTYPAILIGTPEIYYDDATRTSQTGTVSLQVKLVIDCYHDTHYGSSQEDFVKTHMQRFREVQETLHGFAPNLSHEEGEEVRSECGRLCRQSARVYSLAGGINVYETIFQCKVKDFIRADYDGSMSVGMRSDKG